MSDAQRPSPRGPNRDTGEWSSLGEFPELRDLTGVTLGDFQIERRLGQGGMGDVYLARQISLNRQVALKVLRPELLAKESYLKRFEAEATAVAKLNHPNIVHVYTLGFIDGVRFIAMEYVEGRNLRDYLEKKGALDLPQAFSIMKQSALAVGAAGELGLVHRDVKPENILLTRKGQVKITDFGLCRDTDADKLHLTLPGVTMGTPMYMSPEQAQGHKVDHRSDLYSLGVTFYQILAGQPPFWAETPLALALKHVKEAPVSLAVYRPDLPADVVRLVMKTMAKDPLERYQSAAELLRDMSKIKESMQTAPMSLAETSAPTVASASAVAGTGKSSTAPVSRPRPVSPAEGPAGRDWTGVLVGPKALTALAALGLLVGLLAGWAGRPEDLLSAGAREPSGAPGLWIVPGWETTVPRQDSDEAQYRYALVAVPRDDLEAAWLAVPGYHPASSEWASRAYVQLGRALLRRHDGDRLKALAGEISRWGKTQTREQQLADVMRTGSKAISGDLDGVVEDFSRPNFPRSLTDPALMELSLEVTLQALRKAVRSGEPGNLPKRLREIQSSLSIELFQAENRRPLARIRSGERPPSSKRRGLSGILQHPNDVQQTVSSRSLVWRS